MTTSVAVVGASGKLGTLVCRLIAESPDFELVAQLNSHSDLTEMDSAEIVVDVSVPDVSKDVVLHAVAANKKVLVGTSGWSESKISDIETLVSSHPESAVLIIPNFSLGSALSSKLAAIAAVHFDDIEIIETHGPHKIDSPSGTATNTAERIAAARSTPVSAPFADQTARGQLVAGIPVHSLRIPGVLAQQEVVFGADGEKLTISHVTSSERSYEAGILASLRAMSSLTGITVGLDQIISL